MQKSFFVALALLATVSVTAQQLMIEVFSAYNITAYDHEQLSKESYYPLGARIAGGHEYVQVGLEYRQNLTTPDFTIKNASDQDIYKVEYDEMYYGALLRVNISSLPVYRAGIVLKGGVGYYTYTQKSTDLSSNAAHELEFDKKLGYNAGVGLSLPIYGEIHWELGWQYNIISRDANEEVPYQLAAHQANYHSIQLG